MSGSYYFLLFFSLLKLHRVELTIVHKLNEMRIFPMTVFHQDTLRSCRYRPSLLPYHDKCIKLNLRRSQDLLSTSLHSPILVAKIEQLLQLLVQTSSQTAKPIVVSIKTKRLVTIPQPLLHRMSIVRQCSLAILLIHTSSSVAPCKNDDPDE